MDLKEYLKRFKKEKSFNITMGLDLRECKECKEDSIAHEIKKHFEFDTIQSRLLFKSDYEGKMYISKKQLKHLLTLCNTVEIEQDYEFELIDKINIYKT